MRIQQVQQYLWGFSAGVFTVLSAPVAHLHAGGSPLTVESGTGILAVVLGIGVLFSMGGMLLRLRSHNIGAFIFLLAAGQFAIHETLMLTTQPPAQSHDHHGPAHGLHTLVGSHELMALSHIVAAVVVAVVVMLVDRTLTWFVHKLTSILVAISSLDTPLRQPTRCEPTLRVQENRWNGITVRGPPVRMNAA